MGTMCPCEFGPACSLGHARPLRSPRWLQTDHRFTLRNGVIRRNNYSLSLVNTPFMIQHHPWVAFRHGAFSNKSIILHELKNPRSPGWDFAGAHGSGPFEPFRERVCGACESEMRWSSVPGSHVAKWECCGLANDAAAVKEACRKDKRTRCVVAATAA